ncbi:triacylglycerol lipase-like protein [Immersiella caudata]|uniref:GPI inositol-deacylase n=1 Tax=Immersiella caudata TaxID=314043 RepID=A0AA39WJ61_9PEZI|nr:triacylglycerol lipase-like protein [Immersiella caudata]
MTPSRASLAKIPSLSALSPVTVSGPVSHLNSHHRRSSTLRVFAPRLRPSARRTRTPTLIASRKFSDSARRCEVKEVGDARIKGLGKEIKDTYAYVRDRYDAPKYPVVLAHGLLGFAELKLAGSYLPPIHYWRGIKEALCAQNIEVITTSVPPSGSIAQRAAKLAEGIEAHAQGRSVNIVAHSMGGLDARYMISHLKPKGVDVKSLVTVATPHHGSAVADYIIKEIGPENLSRLYNLWKRTTGWDHDAFDQLTRKYMIEQFNHSIPDDPVVRYFSYGAMLVEKPPLLSPFRVSHKLLNHLEGPNDGLVSVQSSQWGTYKGTLLGVNHLDLINWSNRLRFAVRKWLGKRQSFNAIAFYLDIADMLAKEGL